MRLLGMTLLLMGMGSAAFAAVAAVAPEVGPASAGSALALISGAVLILRGRRKK